MSRIKSCFDQLHQTKIKGLIPYITAGDHSFDATVNFFHIMVKAGADILEVGVPFSDPVAEGPVIEKAHHRAVAKGISLKDVLAMIAKFRETNTTTPIVLMGYMNPIEVMGCDSFAESAKDAGVDGVITVDCPPEESDDLRAALDLKDIDIISLVAPNTSDERIKTICNKASGFIYYVSFKGVTGASGRLKTDEVAQRVNHLRSFTSLPIAVGFGIKNGETAATVSKVANAVVVGAALVKTLADYDSDQASAIIEQQITEMRSAMDA